MPRPFNIVFAHKVKQQNYQTGQKGEQIAKQFLEKNGYEIQEQNFRTKSGEIDIIATKDHELVFVEVKLKIGNDFGSPEEMINAHKIAQIQKMAEYYVSLNQRLCQKYYQFRIDAICILIGLNNEKMSLNHWRNITG